MKETDTHVEIKLILDCYIGTTSLMYNYDYIAQPMENWILCMYVVYSVELLFVYSDFCV